MKESYSEVIARHAGLESYADGGNTVGVATTEVHVGRVLSSVNLIPRADVVLVAESNTLVIAEGDDRKGRGGVEDLGHAWKLQAREPGDPIGLLEEVTSSGQKTLQEAMLT